MQHLVQYKGYRPVLLCARADGTVLYRLLQCEADPAVLAKTQEFLAKCKQELQKKGVSRAGQAPPGIVCECACLCVGFVRS